MGLCLGLVPSYQSAFIYSPLDSSSRPLLQESNLPNLEPYLQVEHAELIKVFEKKLADDVEFLRVAAPEKAGDGSKVQ